MGKKFKERNKSAVFKKKKTVVSRDDPKMDFPPFSILDDGCFELFKKGKHVVLDTKTGRLHGPVCWRSFCTRDKKT